MSGVNRFFQRKRFAEFQPLSMQEMAFPFEKQEARTRENMAMASKLSSLGLDINNLPVDNPYVEQNVLPNWQKQKDELVKSYLAPNANARELAAKTYELYNTKQQIEGTTGKYLGQRLNTYNQKLKELEEDKTLNSNERNALKAQLYNAFTEYAGGANPLEGVELPRWTASYNPTDVEKRVQDSLKTVVDRDNVVGKALEGFNPNEYTSVYQFLSGKGVDPKRIKALLNPLKNDVGLNQSLRQQYDLMGGEKAFGQSFEEYRENTFNDLLNSAIAAKAGYNYDIDRMTFEDDTLKNRVNKKLETDSALISSTVTQASINQGLTIDNINNVTSAFNSSKEAYEEGKTLYEEGKMSREDFLKLEDTYKSAEVNYHNVQNYYDKIVSTSAMDEIWNIYDTDYDKLGVDQTGSRTSKLDRESFNKAIVNYVGVSRAGTASEFAFGNWLAQNLGIGENSTHRRKLMSLATDFNEKISEMDATSTINNILTDVEGKTIIKDVNSNFNKLVQENPGGFTLDAEGVNLASYYEKEGDDIDQTKTKVNIIGGLGDNNKSQVAISFYDKDNNFLETKIATHDDFGVNQLRRVGQDLMGNNDSEIANIGYNIMSQLEFKNKIPSNRVLNLKGRENQTFKIDGENFLIEAKAHATKPDIYPQTYILKDKDGTDYEFNVEGEETPYKLRELGSPEEIRLVALLMKYQNYSKLISEGYLVQQR